MSNLMNVYEGMQKKAVLDKEAQERVEILTKYASVAEEMLSDKHGDDYEASDVTKLAEYLIDSDMESFEAQEKVAEYVEAGQIMARSFLSEINTESDNSEE